MSRRPWGRLVCRSLPIVIAAGALVGAPVAASSAAAAPASKAVKEQCIRGGGVAGFAVANGQRIEGASVTVWARGKATGSKRGWFGKPVKVLKNAKTNTMGGFFFPVDCLPPTFLVKVSGGKVAGRPFRDTVMSFGRSDESATIVTNATTAVVRYSQRHPGVGILKAVRLVGRDLGIVRLGPQVVDLGQASWIDGMRPRATVGPRSVASSTMNKVASNLIYSETCSALTPSAAGALACPTDDADAVESALSEISQQLTSLQTSVNEIQDTLSVMEGQISDIEQMTTALVQDDLKTEAQQAQSAYESAYQSAGITQVNTMVQDASLALSVLGTIAPTADDTWPTIPVGSSNEQVCDAVYGDADTAGAQDPYESCVTFLEQTDSFADPSNDRFAALYAALTGAEAVPENDRLIWTYQNALTMGGNSPVSRDVIAGIQSQYSDLGQLASNAFGLLGTAQAFVHQVTRGPIAPCTNVTTSGTFAASTAILVDQPCDTVQTGLFTAAVQDALVPQVLIPQNGVVADPRTNYLWWGYPIDLTGSTQSNATFPVYPGTSKSIYNTATLGWPLGLFFMSQSADEAPLPISDIVPLLTATPANQYWFPDEQTLLGFLSNVPMTGSTIAQMLANQGFIGVGSSSNGMNWTNLGMDVLSHENIRSDRVYQSNPSTQMSSSTPGCTGYPKSVVYVLRCLSSNAFGEQYSGYQYLDGVWASHSIDLTSTQLPTSSSVEECQIAGTDQETGVQWPFCWTDTFGLLVSPTPVPPSGQGSGTTPPFWQPYMLDGPPSAGVPAIPVTPPS